jgi:hypothetical protein
VARGAAVEDAFATIRTARLRAREPNVREEFFEWAAKYDDPTFDGRTRAMHEAWLAGLNVVRIDGALATAAQVAEVLRAIKAA